MRNTTVRTSGLPPSEALRQTKDAPAAGDTMPETCTCGTTLVENARFCHRCGKPTFETEIEPEPQVEPEITRNTSARTPISAIPVGFRNPVALRVAFLMSVAVMLIEMIPVVNVLFVLWWLAAGWGGVRLYRRLT